MNEAKHTPGPWRVEVTSDGWDGKTTHIVAGDGMSVLSGWGYDAWGLSWGASSAESTVEENAVNPDACLISAAPDMLAALKAQEAADEIGIGGDLGDLKNWEYAESEAKKLRRAAIQKSEGR